MAIRRSVQVVYGKKYLRGSARRHSEKMLSEYYSICGWDENGIPTKETLEKLNLHR